MSKTTQRPTMLDNEVLARITALQAMPAKEMKQLWKELYKQPAPEFNRTYLISRLTYRLQELAYGGEDELTEKRLEAMSKAVSARANSRPTQIHRPLSGTRLVREFKGVEYHVLVEPDGFVFDGRKYRSLSRIAFLITGSAWSGPAFFGLSGRKASK